MRYGRRRIYRRNRRHNKRYYRRNKRNFRRYKSSRNRITTRTTRALTGIPDRTRVKLAYTLFVSFTPTGTPDYGYFMRGNGPYDPDFSAVLGNQPTGWDQWVPFYSRSRTYASSLRVNALNRGTTLTSNQIITIVPVLNTNPVPNFEQASTLPYNRSKMIGPVSSGSNGVFLKNYMSTKKMYGQQVTQDDAFSSLNTTTPNRQWYWLINAATLDLTSTVALDLKITITYYIEFFDRVVLPVS